MRLASYLADGRSRAAVVASDQTLVAVADLVSGAPDDMLDLLAAGQGVWDRLRGTASSARGGQPLSDARLIAPIPTPRRNLFCVGWNYLEHFAEGQGMRGPNDDAQQIPDFPALFSKQPACVVGPEAAVWHSAPASDELDWEVELALVIGTPGRDIPEERAYEHVLGYTVANDVSVRDVQRRHGGQWFKGKNFDTHCPLGPWIVTSDEIGDPHQLHITLRVNGATKQDSNTSYMAFRIPRIVKEISTGLQLQAGDVILTGTPSGVGFARKPPEFLKVGDVMEAEIEKIGVLRNRVATFDPSASTGAGAVLSGARA
jgi:2-keto-4-pentenoate hydratase/2-oxohepta-3-ene-1,7-dioic acid hydratase in catechol pathway